ncbi:unnamed protein product [Gordionus sp. m RMFG-2023]
MKNVYNLSLICFANITLNKYVEKEITWLEKLTYVYILGPFLLLGVIGNIFYFIVSRKMSRDDKDKSGPSNTKNDNHLDKDDIILSTKNSDKHRTNPKKNVSLKPSDKIVNDSTSHFYVIIFTILFWDVIACVNFIFFPFLYYASSDLGISNEIFMTIITRVTPFVEEVCATNLNWNTTILSMNRFMALYFPYQFANLTNRNRGKNEPSQRYSVRNNACLKYIRQYSSHLFTLKKTRKSGIILMASIFIFSLFISMPYLFYIDLKKGVRDMNSSRQDTTVVVLYRQVSCDSKLPKNPIKFSYYYKMSKFFDYFSIHYDNFFSILVYLLPTLLITFSQISVFAKLKKLKRTINVQSHVESNISAHLERSLTIPDQNNRTSQLGLKGRLGKLFNSISPKIAPSAQVTPSIRSHLPKSGQNNKTTKSYLDKYILTLAIGIEFMLLNLPYVIYVFITKQTWVDGASSKLAKVQVILIFLKDSNHAVNVYINIIFNSTIRTFLMFQLNKWYRSYLTRTRL